VIPSAPYGPPWDFIVTAIGLGLLAGALMFAPTQPPHHSEPTPRSEDDTDTNSPGTERGDERGTPVRSP
jgi:hypothetical protein